MQLDTLPVWHSRQARTPPHGQSRPRAQSGMWPARPRLKRVHQRGIMGFVLRSQTVLNPSRERYVHAHSDERAVE